MFCKSGLKPIFYQPNTLITVQYSNQIDQQSSKIGLIGIGVRGAIYLPSVKQNAPRHKMEAIEGKRKEEISADKNFLPKNKNLNISMNCSMCQPIQLYQIKFTFGDQPLSSFLKLTQVCQTLRRLP